MMLNIKMRFDLLRVTQRNTQLFYIAFLYIPSCILLGSVLIVAVCLVIIIRQLKGNGPATRCVGWDTKFCRSGLGRKKH